MKKDITESISLKFDETKSISRVQTELPLNCDIISVYVKDDLPYLLVKYMCHSQNMGLFETNEFLIIAKSDVTNNKLDEYTCINDITISEKIFSVFYRSYKIE